VFLIFISIASLRIVMDSVLNIEKKFPKSVNNRQCLAPCFKPGVFITHPITLHSMTHPVKSFCPTEQWWDETYKRHKFIDECYLPTGREEDQKEKIEHNILIPTFIFNCESFLKLYYDISSFETALEWLVANNSAPILTQLRIIECVWKIYGKDLNVLNSQLIDFYSFLIKKKWIKYIYARVFKFITVENGKIFLSENSDDKETNKVEKINYFIDKFLTRQNIYNVLEEFINENKHNWNDIASFNDRILKEFVNYFLNVVTPN